MIDKIFAKWQEYSPNLAGLQLRQSCTAGEAQPEVFSGHSAQQPFLRQCFPLEYNKVNDLGTPTSHKFPPSGSSSNCWIVFGNLNHSFFSLDFTFEIHCPLRFLSFFFILLIETHSQFRLPVAEKYWTVPSVSYCYNRYFYSILDLQINEMWRWLVNYAVCKKYTFHICLLCLQ